MSQIITSRPIPMIQENSQLVPTKLRIEYIYTGTYVPVVITIIGIDKRGHTNIATCTIPDPAFTGKYSSDIFVGIPQNSGEFPFICYTYNSALGFKILGTPELILDQKEYPDVLSSNVYTAASLT